MTVSNAGPCIAGSSDICTVLADMSLKLITDSNTLRATVSKVSFQVGETPVTIPESGDPMKVGDKFDLKFVALGLLKRTIVSGMKGFVGGNPYWCGEDLAEELRYRCGA